MHIQDSYFYVESKLPRVVASLRVPSPGTHIAFMLSPSLWHIDGLVTAGVKHCFPPHDHCGVPTPDAWRKYLPMAIADRKIILTDTRPLANPEKDAVVTTATASDATQASWTSS